jgi:hypothetical protein
MTLNTTDSKIAYAGDGSTISFAIPFKFLANGDIEAVLRDDETGEETTWTENTHYSLSGAGAQAGGTMIAATSPTDYRPPLGTTLVIRRITAETQGAAFPAGGAFPSITIEMALDRLTMLVQQHSESLKRALLAPKTDPAGSIGNLPADVVRASKYLGFDTDGVPMALGSPANTTAVSSFMAPILLLTTAATVRSAIGLGALALKSTITSADIDAAAISKEKLDSRGRAAANLALYTICR